MNLLYDYTWPEDGPYLLVLLSPAGLTLSWQEHSLTLRPSKASRYLTELLLHPYQSISAASLYALVNSVPSAQSPAGLGIEPANVGCGFHNLLPAPLCDEQTIRDIKLRLNIILARLAEAEQWNDLAVREELQQERDSLLAYLQESLAPRQAAVYAGDLDYKCADNVYRSLHQLLQGISRKNTALGNLLESSLHLWSNLIFLPPQQLSVIVRESDKQ